MAKEVILTGIRANGELTLGNYLGAMQSMVELHRKYKDSHQFNMFLADMHSLVTPIEYGGLYQQTMTTLKSFVAAGIPLDDANTFIYRQSHVAVHGEMAWIFDCFTGFGEASRMVEFKDKAERVGQDQVTVGLFNYPVLMAADVLLYGAKWVPVGEDQRQHLELMRNLAMRFNNKFGELFVVPEDMNKQMEFAGRTTPVRVRSLRNPDKKMSKSIDDPAGTILLSDNPDEAAKKVMGATTDSAGSIDFDFEKQPGVSNLLLILALLSESPQDEVNAEWEGKDRYGELKQAVADKVKAFLSDFQSKLAAVDESQLTQKLEKDEAAMHEVAGTLLHKVQQAVGLRPARQ